jgi:membrane fusion protein, multidrug efflux system
MNRYMTVIMKRASWVSMGAAAAAVAVTLLAGERGRAAATPAAPGPPPDVSVIQLAGENVATYRAYPARTYARDLVEVRGRVDGFIEQRTFDIGSDVRAGQVLYVLDVRPYEAEVERARAALAQSVADIAQAEALLLKARQDVERLEPLVKEEAAPRQDLDNALAARQAAAANVTARRAAVDANHAVLRNAELNLEYATIRAPIGGRVGDSLLQVGALVTRTSPQPLTTIVPLDPVWVRFQVSEAEVPLFERSRGPLPIELVFDDGRGETARGRIENTLNSVNTKTGTVQGHAIVTGDRVGQRVLVEQGLTAGDLVIVDGLQKVRAGGRATARR